MKLNNFQAVNTDYTQTTKIKTSRSQENSVRYAQEKNITTLAQQNIVNNYFETFDESYSEIAIKNLISVYLQPAYTLPEVHDYKTLSSKAEELLNFSLTI